MKHEQLIRPGCRVSALLILGLAVSLPAAVHAQFHSGENRGYAAVAGSGNTVGNTPISGSNVPGVAMIRRGELQNAAIVNTGYIDGTSLVSTNMRNADLWARAIIHSDGSYTETKKSEMDGQMLTQKTFSSGGVLLQQRMIMANAHGLPTEVLIKDARGQFKYRGVLLYDRAGRFVEEQLYDMSDRLLRRRIQEYGPNNEPKLRVVDYAKNLPADIQLVITEETVAGNNNERTRRNMERFRREAREVQAASSGAREKKPGLLGRIFGKKKKR